jgi:hypothetical protein
VVRRIPELAGLALTVFAVACSSAGDVSINSPSSSALNAISGTWTATSAAGVAPTTSSCHVGTFTVTPTDATNATITYSVTCTGIQISGTGTGTMNGTTLNWTTTGTNGSCSFSLTGTAVSPSTTELDVTYTGTVCGVPVSGSEVMNR